MANGWGEWKESETTDGSQAKVNVVSQALTTHDSKNASLTTKGHVQLSSSVTSTSTSLAATPSAVKAAMDRANEAFQSASNGKTLVGNAITGFDSKITLPANPSFQDLADAIDRIRLVILEPGANLFASSDREIGFYNSSYQVQKEIIVPYGGTIRVSFQAASYFNGSAYYRIYVNGSPIGIQRVLTNSGQFTTFTQDIAIKAGDRVQLFAYSTNGTAYARNFNISTNLLSATVVL
ncbi:tail fiber protein [Cytobacillus gottheilii]|uniref:Tail fiber protein n=2 Tax=Cytobacillus gottheilii TaxID=859144 RepID=A0ABX8FIL1_9BACI|nr:tail fiber protein [Cytobacillus gottheilii]